MVAPLNKLELGALTIEWSGAIELPIAASIFKPGWYVTQCPVTYRYGDYAFSVVAGFVFDGASIPWFVRCVPGFAAHDWHLFAALIHDFICEHPEVLPRPVGDGIFVSVMLAIATHRELTAGRSLISRKLQAWLMFMAVSIYTMSRAWRGEEIQKL